MAGYKPAQARLWMPTPPSVNCLFRDNDGHRYKTQEYALWQKTAMQEIQIQRVKPIAGRVMLDFFHGNRSPIADCSNYIKAAEDVLVEMGLIEGDSAKCVQRVTSCWVPNYTGTVVHITPWEDALAPWIGFDAGVLGQVDASPLERFIKSNQTLGKARRAATGETWKSAPGETGRSRANVRMAAKRRAPKP